MRPACQEVKPAGFDTDLIGNQEMNARVDTSVLSHLSNRHLDALEEETIFVLREVAAAFERPTLLFSGGKDSLVMLRCAEKAFGKGRIPYPLRSEEHTSELQSPCNLVCRLL